MSSTEPKIKLRLEHFYPRKKNSSEEEDPNALPVVANPEKDPNGDYRGRCELEGCRCRQYKANPDSEALNQISCIMCGHAPLQHLLCQKGPAPPDAEEMASFVVDPMFIARPPPGQTFHVCCSLFLD